MDDLEQLQEILREDPAPTPTPRHIRPELIMGILAGVLAVAFLVLLVMCMPYFSAGKNEDPQALRRPEPPLLLAEPEAQTESTESSEPAEEETTPPTIPPEANPYGRLHFQYNRSNYLYCTEQPSYAGVDVSAFQGDIDWQKVKDSGISFAMLRLGYRGWGKKGTLVEDEYIQKNLEKTKAVGLPIGAYFFSQATSIQEVDEEIAFMLKILGDYTLSLPIVLDWEIPGGAENPRTANMDPRTLTEMQKHFCQEMEKKGFEPMIYFNWTQSSNLLYLSELEDYAFWLALYQDRMVYPWHVEMWQYTQSGTVPGIQGPVDINVYMPKLYKQ